MVDEKARRGSPYEISFKYSKRQLPNWFQIDFEDVKIGFYVSEANLPLIIDSLKTVKSPLSVYHVDRRSIDRITYDKKEQMLRIEEKKEEKMIYRLKQAAKKSRNSFEGWAFIPGEGFYAEEPHEFLKRPVLMEKRLHMY